MYKHPVLCEGCLYLVSQWIHIGVCVSRLPLCGCEWCHCQPPHVALTAPNHTSCVVRTSRSTLQPHWFCYVSITVVWGVLCPGCVVHQDSGGHRVHQPFFFRLIPYKPDFFFFLSSLQFGPIRHQEQAAGLVLTMQHDSNKKPRVFLLFLFRDQYILQEKLLPQRQEYVNFCFTPSVFGKKKETSNRGYIKQRTRTPWSLSECNEVTLH